MHHAINFRGVSVGAAYATFFTQANGFVHEYLHHLADAALQAQVRLRAGRIASAMEVPGCFAVTFRPTPWAKQQKSRIESIYVPEQEREKLELFEIALAADQNGSSLIPIDDPMSFPRSANASPAKATTRRHAGWRTKSASIWPPRCRSSSTARKC